MPLNAAASAVALDRVGIADAADAIRAWLPRARWFGGRERRVRGVELEDLGVIRSDAPTVLLTLWRVDYAGGGSEVYSLPLGVRPTPPPLAELGPDHLIATLTGRREGSLLVYDALADPEAADELWRLLDAETSVPTNAGRLEAHRLTPIESPAGELPHLLGVQQTNSALVRGQRDFLKWNRLIEPGPSAELEMVEALTSRGFPHLAALRGYLAYARAGQPPAAQAILQAYLPNGSEGWAMAQTSLRDLYDVAESTGAASTREHRELVDEQGGSFEPEAVRLGEVTAELHLALADPNLPPALAPTRVTSEQLAGWATSMTSELDHLLQSAQPAVAPLAAKRDLIAARFEALRGLGGGGLAIRTHGDFHLGQVLRTDDGWKIVDFGGEPRRSAQERRERSSPLRDVAGMLRSFDYAAAAALRERTDPSDPLWPRLLAAGRSWAAANREAYWAAYLGRAAGSELLPHPGATMVLRRAFELSKAVYEIGYELGHRPEWASIPLDFLLSGDR